MKASIHLASIEISLTAVTQKVMMCNCYCCYIITLEYSGVKITDYYQAKCEGNVSYKRTIVVARFNHLLHFLYNLVCISRGSIDPVYAVLSSCQLVLA